MSSAVPAGRGSAPAMHWCHECGIEMRPLMTPGPTCPRCNGEFVEEIDPSNPIIVDNDDEEEEDDEDNASMIDAPRPFAGAAGRDNGTFAQPGMDLGTLIGGIVRGLASAGSQSRPAGSTPADRSQNQNTQGQSSTSSSNFRSGSSQAGSIAYSWGFQTTGGTSASTSASNSRTSQIDTPFAVRAPLRMNEFLRQHYDSDGHHHDDGMGGAGGAADGRFFNADNRTANGGTGEGRIDDIDEDEEEQNRDRYPPEMGSIRDIFANLFGGMGDGPAGMLMDIFGGGSGRTGDYVWGERGLDDVITQLMEQTRGSTAPPPATEEAIKRLERFSRKDTAKVRQARNRECSTCMDSFEEEEEGQSSVPEPSMDSNRLTSTYRDVNDVIDDDDPPEVVPTDEQQDELMMMPCKHLFHLDCLLPWLQTNGTCPVCRVSLETEKDKNKDKQTSAEGSSSNRPGESSASAIEIEDDEDEDDSPEAIRQRSRRAAEARMAGRGPAATREPRQTVPGSFLEPDELD